MHGTTIIVRTCVVSFLEYNKSHYVNMYLQFILIFK